ncbi:TraX family protein [Miniphocaeibacter halophilus]|uniref:Beta-carotene 15,15'-monooxygenase n=1 Tax=Miniphocaeibacter halophilus TaxID=2931922 RepID=A0AC61MSY8_9FIRM|nr:TraX family protein [Miniphocaeibacter halophilus]QQK08785.1 beta-carotene 15,15'-monooxygenase [Miniphocaeibacter halophilus]
MTGTSLKFLMAFLMVLDHIGYFIPIEWQAFFHFISRPVAAVFAFLSVQGFIHTRKREDYIKRLYLAGIIMFVGNMAINNLIIKKPEFFVYNSMFLSLALGVTALYILEGVFNKGNSLLGILLILGTIILGMFTEGGYMIIILMLIVYINRNNPLKRDFICLIITAVFIILMIFYLVDTSIISQGNMREILISIGNFSDLLFFAAGIPFFHLYNGKRGKNTRFTKYFFYVFYPMHLWIIGIIASKIA